MFSYNKFLEFPVKVSKPNPRLANVVITQYGGPNCNCLSSVPLISKTRILAFSRPLRHL